MSPVSVLEAVAIPLALFAWIYLAHWAWRREQARKARWEHLWLERQRERYYELEFQVTPPPFDFERDAA